MVSIELDPVKSGAEALKSIAEAVKTAMDAVYGFVDRRKATKAAKWAHVRDAAIAVQTLATEHAETARIITAPARVRRDMAATAELLREVVDSSRLPLAYQALQGELEQLITDKDVFNLAGAIIRSLRIKISIFEYEAFMVEHSSWRMATAIEWIAEAIRLLREPEPRSDSSEARIAELRASLSGGSETLCHQNAWEHFRMSPNQQAPIEAHPEPVTAEEMETCVQNWLKMWFEKVQQTLYEPDGIVKLAAKLKMMSNQHT